MKLLLKLLAIFAIFLLIEYFYLHNLDNFLLNQIGLTQEILVLFMAICTILFIKNKRVKLISSTLILATFFLIFSIQILSLKITGDLVNIATVANAGQFMLLLNSSMVINILILASLFFVIYKIAKTLLSTKYLEVFIILLITIALYAKLINYKHSLGKIDTLMPIKGFYETINDFLKLQQTKVSKLSKDELNIAKEYNIKIDPTKKRPFQKEYIYKTSLSIKDNSGTKKPNIILFFVESLSARLLAPYNSKMDSVTPNIKDFAKNAMVVKGYYNHATPTAPALYGQNCSLYPLLRYDDFNKEANPLKHLKLNCLAHYFTKAKYNTIYLSHSKGIYSHIKENLHLWGYRDIYLWKDLLKKYIPKDKEIILGETGLSDHQMTRALVNYLKEYNSTKPFLLGISTIESHVGFEPNSIDGIKYKDGSSNTLNMIHNLDDAFKIFWNYFKTSKYAKNTIVILTGDHALYPNIDYQKVAGKNWIPSVYDELALIIYDPIHKLPKTFNTNSSSIDLAPTVINLANLPKKDKNSFLGTSLFDIKEYNNSFGISAYPDFKFYLNKNGKVVNKKIKELTDSYEDKELKKEYYSLKKMMQYIYYLQSVDRF